jgi:putative salt-induced outer membrane protein YdiY
MTTVGEISRYVLMAAVAVSAVSGWAPAQTPHWDLKLGFSYLGTTGNSRTSSTGLSAAFQRTWGDAQLQAMASALRATDDGEKNAERFLAGVRGDLTIWKELALTSGLSWERDRFAGIDARSVFDAGLKWSPQLHQALAFAALVAATYTREEQTGRPAGSFVGALAKADAAYAITATTKATLGAALYPNFETTKAWRATTAAGLQASLSSQLALKLAWEYRYNNRPPAGFRKADTATVLSLVAQFPKLT